MTRQVNQWDGDLDDPRQRCPHGTFIGSWWGPDYLCPACECPHDDFDEEGYCSHGCGYMRDGSPEPPPPDYMHCEWVDTLVRGVDYGPVHDGSTIEIRCGRLAEHTLRVIEHYNPEPPHHPYEITYVYCREHLAEAFGPFREHDDGTLRATGHCQDTEFVRVEIGKVEPSSPWNPQYGHEMLLEMREGV